MGGVTEGKGVGQLAAIVIGAAYAVGGVIGFGVTGFSGVTAPVGHKLLFLTLNPFQDFIHLGIGALLLLAGLKWTAAATEGVLLGVGGIYVIAAVTGFIYAHIPVITIVGGQRGQLPPRDHGRDGDPRRGGVSVADQPEGAVGNRLERQAAKATTAAPGGRRRLPLALAAGSAAQRPAIPDQGGQGGRPGAV
jgi:hypothetical protein